jgi:flagellar basal-body rod protein FlgB
MSYDFLGAESQAIKLCERRALHIAKNLANVSTPNYQAKDIDFHNSFAAALSRVSDPVHTTNPRHIPISGNGAENPKEYYRVPILESLDGNTVEEETERKNFTENGMYYTASLNFAQNKVKLILDALKGGG